SGYCQREPRFGGRPEDVRQLLALHDDLAEHARRQGWSELVVSCDAVADFLPPNTLGVPAHERQGVRLDVRRSCVGASIFALTDEDAQADVRDSHFVLLHEGEALTPPSFPAAGSLRRLRPWLREHCRS